MIEIAEGTRLLSLRGEVATDEDDNEIFAPPGTEGVTIGVRQRPSGTIYDADFGGVWVSLSADELLNTYAYSVLYTPEPPFGMKM